MSERSQRTAPPLISSHQDNEPRNIRRVPIVDEKKETSLPSHKTMDSLDSASSSESSPTGRVTFGDAYILNYDPYSSMDDSMLEPHKDIDDSIQPILYTTPDSVSSQLKETTPENDNHNTTTQKIHSLDNRSSNVQPTPKKTIQPTTEPIRDQNKTHFSTQKMGNHYPMNRAQRELVEAQFIELATEKKNFAEKVKAYEERKKRDQIQLQAGREAIQAVKDMKLLIIEYKEEVAKLQQALKISETSRDSLR